MRSPAIAPRRWDGVRCGTGRSASDWPDNTASFQRVQKPSGRKTREPGLSFRRPGLSFRRADRVFFQKSGICAPRRPLPLAKIAGWRQRIVPSRENFLYGNRAPVTQDLKDLLPGVLAGDKKSWDAFVRTYNPL